MLIQQQRRSKRVHHGPVTKRRRLLVVVVVTILLGIVEMSNQIVWTANALSENNKMDPTSSSSCVEEFGQCVTNRDCCQGLECILGDWQYTTDSTCLSPKSQEVDAAIIGMTVDDKTNLLQHFYTSQNIAKTNDEVAKIAYKYRHQFPRLVAKLEQKYGEGSFPNIALFRGNTLPKTHQPRLEVVEFCRSKMKTHQWNRLHCLVYHNFHGRERTKSKRARAK
jgi:hypothetical protein